MKKSIFATVLLLLFVMSAIAHGACVLPGNISGISASDGTSPDHIYISWNPDSYATSYEVYRNRPIDNNLWPLIGTTPGNSWVDNGAIPGENTRYMVFGKNSCGYSPHYSDGLWLDDTDAGYRACPTSKATLQASDGANGTSIFVAWDAQPYAIRYDVYRSENTTPTTKIGSTSNTSYTDASPSLVPGKIYYYWAEAVYDYCPSVMSTYDTGYVKLTQPPGVCVPDNTTLCLNNGRFKVQVAWENQLGQSGSGHVAPAGSNDSGLLWFFSQPNWEMLVKVLNGCGINDRFWVFFAATTDQKFILTVTDTITGATRLYNNEMRHPADAVTDTSAFDTCSSEDAIAGESFDMDDLGFPPSFPLEADLSDPYTEDGDSALVEAGGCVASDTVMCLNQDRFRVEVDWKSQDGRSGSGRVVPYGTDDSGMFWFFSQSNWEMLIKVLNGCSVNNKYWVYFAATTDQEFTVTVTDTLTQETAHYTNPMKHPANAVTDSAAFATCP